MMVRFATTCDHCAKRSEEYTAFPSCRECMDDICPECAEPGTFTDPDVDRPSTCICHKCAVEMDLASDGLSRL